METRSLVDGMNAAPEPTDPIAVLIPAQEDGSLVAGTYEITVRKEQDFSEGKIFLVVVP